LIKYVPMIIDSQRKPLSIIIKHTTISLNDNIQHNDTELNCIGCIFFAMLSVAVLSVIMLSVIVPMVKNLISRV
jgi:hypothetical protein